MAALSRLLILLCAGLFCMNSSARQAQYTESESGRDQIALGFPVPQVVDSNSALAGFRSYQSLIDRLSLSALQRSDFSRMQVGSSLNNRPIYAFRFGTTDNVAMLQSGGMHAREWASPEAVTGIAEQLMAAADDGGIESYLRDNSSIILIPVLNPDGFIATQQNPATTLIGEDPNDSANPASAAAKNLTPREGRMRRKNLRDSDGNIETTSDNLLGVDLNRNIGRFWASSGRSSNSPDSIVYHGATEASEPETRALIAASRWLPEQNLRLYIDTHSFGRVYFYNRTGNERLHNITLSLVNKIRLAPNRAYSQAAESSGLGIGASDEYFAYERQVPSYTLEIEPGSSQTAEYGGNAGISHSGFILPDAEVPRMRSEIYAMARLAYYHQSGPAILQQLQIFQQPEGRLVVDANWQGQINRQLNIEQKAALLPGGDYRLVARFSKPMRWRDEQGQIGAYPGQAAPLAPQISLVSGPQSANLDSSRGRWLDAQYQADSFELDFILSDQLSGTSQFHISARDLAGVALDADPSTAVSWQNGAWYNFEDEQGVAGDVGGQDRNISFSVQGPDLNPPQSNTAGGSGSLGLWLFFSFSLFRRRNTG